MKELEGAKKMYESIPIPPELGDIVAKSLERKPRKVHRWYKVALTTAASVCILFVALLNCNSVFAKSVYDVPVIGNLARVFTFRQYSVEDETRQISVKQPQIANTGNSELEERINREINTRVQAAIEEGKKRVEEDKKAFVETGGDPKDFIPAIVDVNYDVKCSNANTLSFVLNATQTQAQAYTEQTYYNIDLKSGRELTLSDLLGKDYKQIVDEQVRKQIKERSKNPDNTYFEGEAGFQGISSDQNFYINTAGHAVIVFNKYDIAPGYMGIQEFEIVK